MGNADCPETFPAAGMARKFSCVTDVHENTGSARDM